MCSPGQPPDNWTDDDFNFTFDGSDDLSGLNVSSDIPAEERIYHQLCHISKHIVLPLIFSCGIIGNALNILIFTRRKFRQKLDDIEKSATTGLVALALSDLLFCTFGLPEAFLPAGSQKPDTVSEVAALYYKAYRQPIMNVFLLASTWLVVVISAERYLAVVYPLRARWMVRLKRTIIIDVSVYLLSVALNIPGFLKYKIERRLTCDGAAVYMLLFTDVYVSSALLRHTYHVMWTVLGTFVPLTALVLCNVRLLVEVYRSRRRYAAEQRKYSTSKITFILMAVILLYLLLVCPSMLLTFFGSVVTTGSERSFFRYRIAISLTNMAQALNFATNFLLYCVISKPFRESLRAQISACTGTGASSASAATANNSMATTQRYYVVETNKTP